MRVLLILAVALTMSAVCWLITDWLNSALNLLPISLGPPDSFIEGVLSWLAVPIIILANIIGLIGLPGQFVGAPVLIGLAVFCGLAGGGLRFYHSRR